MYKALNVRVVGVSSETWTAGDRYGTFNSDSIEALYQFRDYVRAHVSLPHDAAMLLT